MPDQLGEALAQAKRIRDRCHELDTAIDEHVRFLSALDDDRLAPVATTLPFPTKAEFDESAGQDRFERERRLREAEGSW